MITNEEERQKQRSYIFIYETIAVSSMLGLFPIYQLLLPNDVHRIHLSYHFDKIYKLILIFTLSFISDFIYMFKRKNRSFPIEIQARHSHHGIFISHLAVILVFFSHSIALHSPHNPWADLFDYVFHFSFFCLITDLQILLQVHPFVQILISCLVTYWYFDLLIIFGIFLWYLSQKIFPKCFTTGESWMITSAIIFLIKDDKMNLGVEIYLLKALIIGSLFLSFILKFFFPGPFKTPREVFFQILRFILGAIFFVLPWLSKRFPIHPFHWLIQFITMREHLWILLYWIIILTLSLFSFNISNLSKLEKTHARKYFHLIALLLFVPITYLNPNFMYNSYTIVLCLFIFSEWLRLSEMNFISNSIQTFISPFFDEKDKGFLKISHISLLLGCSLPMWLTMEPSHHLLYFSGLIIVGVGDAFASIVGKTFGFHKILKNGSKSWEGCLAGFISSFFTFWLFSLYVGSSLSQLQYIFIAISTFCCSFLESVTEQNDNIIVSIYYFSILNLLLNS